MAITLLLSSSLWAGVGAWTIQTVDWEDTPYYSTGIYSSLALDSADHPHLSYYNDTAPGDYNGDGTWAAGIFRSSSGLWAARGVTRSYFGSGTDEPVPAGYSGATADEIGIFRNSSGLWAIRGSTRVYFGGSSDIPVTR